MGFHPYIKLSEVVEYVWSKFNTAEGHGGAEGEKDFDSVAAEGRFGYVLFKDFWGVRDCSTRGDWVEFQVFSAGEKSELVVAKLHG